MTTAHSTNVRTFSVLQVSPGFVRFQLLTTYGTRNSTWAKQVVVRPDHDQRPARTLIRNRIELGGRSALREHRTIRVLGLSGVQRQSRIVAWARTQPAVWNPGIVVEPPARQHAVFAVGCAFGARVDLCPPMPRSRGIQTPF